MPNNTYARQSSNPARTNSLDSGLTGQTRTPAKQVCYRSATHAFGPCLGQYLVEANPQHGDRLKALGHTHAIGIYATLGSNPTD
jgi:hypothetical protein